MTLVAGLAANKLGSDSILHAAAAAHRHSSGTVHSHEGMEGVGGPAGIRLRAGNQLPEDYGIGDRQWLELMVVDGLPKISKLPPGEDSPPESCSQGLKVF